MGIYIKGMEVPKSCGECLEIGWQYVFECNLDDVEEDEKLITCPLIPVLPHGRLVDADALIEDIWRQRRIYQMLDDTQTGDKIMHGLFRAEQLVNDAPTIIPAEEGE